MSVSSLVFGGAVRIDVLLINNKGAGADVVFLVVGAPLSETDRLVFG